MKITVTVSPKIGRWIYSVAAMNKVLWLCGTVAPNGFAFPLCLKVWTNEPVGRLHSVIRWSYNVPVGSVFHIAHHRHPTFEEQTIEYEVPTKDYHVRMKVEPEVQ